MLEPATRQPPGDDWELLRKASRGDEDSFRILVERHQTRLVGLCRRLLGEEERALDAAQEVFLRAYRNAETLEPRGRFFTWLYRVAVNHCLNRLRRQRIVRMLPLPTGKETTQTTARQVEPEDRSPDAHRELDAKRRWARVRSAIASLPPSQRTVLVLAKYEGLSYREIAETLGVSIGAVESRLFRAMRQLRNL